MQDEKSSKEARFIMNTKWITKEKIIVSPEERGELEWILLANSTRLSVDTRRYPSGILPFGSMLHWKSFLCIQRQFFSKQRAWNLFTHNIVNVISAAAFLACSTGNFLCLHSLNFDFLFVCFFFTILFRKDCFVRFFLLLALRLWVRVTWNQHKQHSLLSSQASLRFGNIVKINFGMNCREKRIIGL